MQKKTNWRLTFQLFFSFLILYSFYELGLSVYMILAMGLLFVLIILFKTKLYNKFDNLLVKQFPALSKQKQGIRKAIVIVAFILSYIILKQIIFFILSQFGIDVKQIILNSINQSMSE
jgi:hypothetical protein